LLKDSVLVDDTARKMKEEKIKTYTKIQKNWINYL
jgi:hypothetical protein